jgi:hypothetical protein
MAAVRPEQPEPRMTVSRVVISDIGFLWIVNGRGEGVFEAGCALVRTVPTTRVAAISALEEILRGEDHVGAFIVEVPGL